jgi:hypothetical protein
LTERLVEVSPNDEYFKALAAERFEREMENVRRQKEQNRAFARACEKWVADTIEALGRGNSLSKHFVARGLRFDKDTFLAKGELWSGNELQTIAKRMGFSVRTVQRVIPIVVATKRLRIVRPLNPTTGRYEHNRYQAICKPDDPLDEEIPF